MSEHLQLEQIDGLVAAAGVDGAREILDAFWRSTTQLLDTLSGQLRTNSFELAAATAHAVKGSAANVGAAKLSIFASQLEEACKNCDEEAVHQALQNAREEFAAVRVCFEEHLASA